MFLCFSIYCYFASTKYLNFYFENEYINNLLKNILKKFFIYIIIIFFFLFFYYFYLLILDANSFSFLINKTTLNNFYFFNFNKNQFNLNIYSFLLLFMCLITGLISISTISNFFSDSKIRLYIVFLQFLLTVFGFITTNDLIFFFFFYELLLLGSFLIVYYGSYSKKATQASLYFVIWTQLGSILVFLGIIYIYIISGTTNFFLLKHFYFNRMDNYIIYSLIFFGFGFKLPIWPFHYWLTKTHVEAPSGFSIYLSGFLVKTALFGFYKLNSFLNFELSTSFFLTFLIIGSIDASIKLWGQTDLKKLVAYCTVQEMNLITIFFLKGDSEIIVYGFIFNFTHAFLSTVMFYLVECIYIRYFSRSIFVVKGIFFSFNQLSLGIIFMCIVFSGIPGTFKFVCEFYVFNSIFNFSTVVCFFLIFFVNVIGLIGFSKNWFNALFSSPNVNNRNLSLDLNKKEALIICLCFMFLTIYSYFPIYLV